MKNINTLGGLTLILPVLATVSMEFVFAAPPPTMIAQEAAAKQQNEKQLIIGEVEYVVLQPSGLVLGARIDTGAKTSSMGTGKLEEFERDGRPWVRFVVTDPKSGEEVPFTLPVERVVKIKRHDGKSERRPVVMLRILLGPIDLKREFSLVDRSNFEYPVLLGRNYLRDYVIVDVSKKHTVKPKPDEK